MVNRKFTAVYKKSGKWFTAWIEEIPGVNTQSRTLKEVRENLKDAVLLIVQANKELLGSKIGFKRESLLVALPV